MRKKRDHVSLLKGNLQVQKTKQNVEFYFYFTELHFFKAPVSNRSPLKILYIVRQYNKITSAIRQSHVRKHLATVGRENPLLTEPGSILYVCCLCGSSVFALFLAFTGVFPVFYSQIKLTPLSRT